MTTFYDVFVINFFRKVGEAVRTVFGRKSVESGVPQALTRQSTLLEDYFDEFEFEGELGASDKANSKKVGVSLNIFHEIIYILVYVHLGVLHRC